MNLNSLTINDCFTTRKASLYFISLVDHGLLYVGESCQAKGIIGRLSQHLSEAGTLTQRSADFGISSLGRIDVTAVDVSHYDGYSHLISPRRKAVEFLVQCRIKSAGCKAKYPFQVISNVFSNEMIWDKDVVSFADTIVQTVTAKIPFFQDQTVNQVEHLPRGGSGMQKTENLMSPFTGLLITVLIGLLAWIGVECLWKPMQSMAVEQQVLRERVLGLEKDVDYLERQVEREVESIQRTFLTINQSRKALDR